MQRKGFASLFNDVWMLDGVRTPMVDPCGALGHVSPTDLGIKAARAVFERAGVPGSDIDLVIAGEIVPVITEKFELAGYAPRGTRLLGKVTEVAHDTHARNSPVETLAKLRPAYEGGVQTGGNSAALVHTVAAAVVSLGAYAKIHGKKPLARIVGAAAVGVPPEIMGIGPAPAIRLLLERCGLTRDQIGVFEINEAQGAQTLSVGRELGLNMRRLNVNGGAIALGHPLAATGVRLTITVAGEMQRAGLRCGISSACDGDGQGMALLLENPDAA